VTHVEDAEQVAREPRRRFAWNVALVLGVLMFLTVLLVVWHDLQIRAETAETSAVSLAEQVQTACESNGELRIDGRDLCEQADDVVDGVPVAGPAGPPGPQGERGERGFTGLRGMPGEDGRDGRDGQDSTGVGPQGEIGPQGIPGSSATAGQIAAAVANYCATGACDGPAGAQGEPGAQGVHGEQGPRGVPGTVTPGTYACPDGEAVTRIDVTEGGVMTLTCSSLWPPTTLQTQ
jgi:hypothetical protein